MRTTVTFDDDVACAVQKPRRSEGIGVSAAAHQIIRSGLVRLAGTEPYRHPSSPLGLRLDISNVGDVVDLLDGA